MGAWAEAILYFCTFSKSTGFKGEKTSPAMAKRFEGVSTKLYVGNLPETCTKANLLGTFERFGTVAECDIIKNYAFVHFESADDAKAAADSLDGSDMDGTSITVQLSRSRVRQKPGMGDVNGCYRCGEEGHWSKNCTKYPPGGSRGRDDRRGGRGGRGGYRGDRDDYYDRPPYREPYGYGRDAYDDPYYDDYYRRPLPPPRDRYRPYDDPYARPRRPPADPYYDRDPYSRPPPDYYRRSPPRDPYYDAYKRDPYAAR